MIDYLPRVVDTELDELVAGLPAILLEGAKGVGKTETARRHARTVYQMDLPSQRAIAEADADQVLTGDRPVLIDEWQRVPEVWDAVRRAVDRDPAPGRFLLTGSASPRHAPTHSGAGRIVSIRMRPLTLAERRVATPTVSLQALLRGGHSLVEGRTEVGLADYVDEIVTSGYPGMRHRSERALLAQIDGYLARIVEVDFEEQGLRVRRPETLRRWLAAYAAATATTASYEKIRDAATAGWGEKPAKTTTQPYRETLEQLWIADPVPAWLPSRNRLGRLAQPPKHHLADPALAVRLLGLDADGLKRGEERGPVGLRDGTLLGHLFESLVTMCVRAYAQNARSRVLHLRTQGGLHEIDLIVERPDQRVLAIEVKLSASVQDSDVKHLLWLRERLGKDLLDSVVINSGPYAYRRKDGVAVVPAALLGP